MLIYCYADILGYRDLLRKHSVSEIHNILNDALSEMHSFLDAYIKTEKIKETYKEGILYNDDYRVFSEFWGNKELVNSYFAEIYNNLLHFKIKTYFAFDTIVIYWENFQYTPYHTKVFTLAVAAIYLLLYMKDILIRGAMGVSEEYYIGDNDKIFIVKNIDIAAEIEKMQNWGNILVFGKELLYQYYLTDNEALTDDFFARYFFDSKHCIEFVPFKYVGNEAYTDLMQQGKTVAKIEDISIRSTLISVCPINNFCISYFGLDFFQELFKKTEVTIKTEVETLTNNKMNHPSLLRYMTARFLNCRISSCISNNNWLLKEFPMCANQLWTKLDSQSNCINILRKRLDVDSQYSI